MACSPAVQPFTTSRSSGGSPELTPQMARPEKTEGLPESQEQRLETSLLVNSHQTSSSLTQLSCYQHRKEITVAEKRYTSYQEVITVHKRELTSIDISRTCQRKMRVGQHLDAEVYLKPKTIREEVDCCLEVRLEAATRGELREHIRSKLKTCFVRVVTAVTENESGLVLAQHTNKKLYPMTEDGSAGYEWKLISHDELEKCSTNKKVAICIEIFLHVREWRDYETSVAEHLDDFVTIFSCNLSPD